MSQNAVGIDDRQPVLSALAGVMAVSGLSYFATAPFVALYVVLAIALIGLIMALIGRDPLLRAPPFLAIYAAFALVAITLPFVWHNGDDVLGVVIFLPLLAAIGVAGILGHDRRWLGPHAMPILALIGVLAAFAVGLVEYLESGGQRVGVGNNPIHYGGIGVILGYLAFTGSGAGKSLWRHLFLLGPIAGAATAIISQSRGPLLAWALVAIIVAPFLVVWFWRRIGLWVIVAVAIIGISALYTGGLGGRAASFFSAVETTLQGGATPGVDAGRSILYASAWEQFLASPIVGHGFTQLMAVAGPRLAEIGQTGLEHLHSDLADLGVVAGSLGLLAYLCLLGAPLLLLGDRTVRADRALVLGCVILPASYAALGLTNAMFGVLPQTVLYAVALGFLTARARALTG